MQLSDYDYFGEINEGRIDVTKIIDKQLLYGFIDEYGNEVVSLIYNLVWPFKRGIALVSKDIEGQQKWGYINRDGEIVIPIKYKYASHINNGFINLCDFGTAKWGSFQIEKKKILIDFKSNTY